MKTITLVALAFPRRDLSPALVGLVEFAKREPTLDQEFEFVIRQFQYRDNLEDVARELSFSPSNVYAFSCYVWNIHECLKVARLVKAKFPQAVILLGGPEASGLAEYLMDKYPFVDFIIKGEGEEPFRQFLRYLAGHGECSDIPALVFRQGRTGGHTSRTRLRRGCDGPGKLLQNSLAGRPDIASLPAPWDSPYYLDYLSHVPEPVTVTFETARGCPFRCRYCTWGGQDVRFYPLERVFAGLERLLNHPGVSRIYITDSDIFLKKSRGKSILNFLLTNNPHKKPVIFEVNPELLDAETTELISRFRENEFAFGLQSSSPTVLSSINRRFNPARYQRNIMRLKALKPDICIWFSLIVGLPGDCLATFKESLAFAVSMSPHSLYIHEFLCLPGSEFFNNQAKYGILCQTEAPHKLLYHRSFGQKDYLSAKELGFYVSLFHYYRFIKEPLLELYRATSSRPMTLLGYYERLIWYLRNKIDLTGGNSVKDIPSFLFDEYYQRATANRALTGRLKSLFENFYAMLETELETRMLVFGETVV